MMKAHQRHDCREGKAVKTSICFYDVKEPLQRGQLHILNDERIEYDDVLVVIPNVGDFVVFDSNDIRKRRKVVSREIRYDKNHCGVDCETVECAS